MPVSRHVIAYISPFPENDLSKYLYKAGTWINLLYDSAQNLDFENSKPCGEIYRKGKGDLSIIIAYSY